MTERVAGNADCFFPNIEREMCFTKAALSLLKRKWWHLVEQSACVSLHAEIQRKQNLFYASLQLSK